jgi:hypothetical protein
MNRIGIVAHALRSKHAEALARTVQADFISVDTNGLMGCDQNHETVQQHLAALPSTYSVILEDDAVLIDGFREQLDEALILAPTPIVSLYLGRQRPPWAQNGIQAAISQAREANADWIIGTHLLHAVGYAIKTDLMASLLNFPSTPLPIDQHISRWAQTYGHLVSYAFPSLVDHADLPTIVDHPDGQPRTPGRVAWETAAHADWSTRSVTMRI